MKIFVFFSLLSLVHPAPAPQDEAVEAVPYIHEEIAEDQEEPGAAALVVPHAVYSYSPLAPVAVTQYAGQPDGVQHALFSPFPLVAGYKAGCVNSLGSVVPCHL